MLSNSWVAFIQTVHFGELFSLKSCVVHFGELLLGYKLPGDHLVLHVAGYCKILFKCVFGLFARHNKNTVHNCFVEKTFPVK